MENLETIKKLRKNAGEIRNLFQNKIPKWKSDPHTYDKTGWGFNKDDRFNACTPISIAFSSHMGTYGDSGCSSECSLSADIFNKHLVDYLNRNKEQIMLSVADSIENEAKTLKEKAESELQAELAKLSEL